MTSITPSTDDKVKNQNHLLSYRKDYKDSIEIDLGHVPDYDEEQESEIPRDWYEPIKD